MSYTIYSALEHLGLTAQKRAIHIQFSNNTLNEQVFLQHIEGTHTLHSGIKLQLICLSTHAHIPLKQFIGSQTAIDIVTDRSELTRISGIVTQAEIGASDGSLTLYRLTVEDATALWKHRRNSRVFMNKTAVEIIQVIFKEWQLRSPLFASSLSLDLSGLSKDYDVRPFTMQYNEADTNLIQRLLAEEGISSLIDEAQLKVSSSKQPIQAQKLRLIDNNNQYQALERRNIRFHRSSAVEQSDSITSFIGQRTIQPTAVHIQRWQADILVIEDGAGSVLTKHRHSDNQNTESLGLEQAWHFSPAWTPDLNGADGVTPSGTRQVERFNDNLSHYHRTLIIHDYLFLLYLEYTAGKPIQELVPLFEKVIEGYERQAEALAIFRKSVKPSVISGEGGFIVLTLISLAVLLNKKILMPKIEKLINGEEGNYSGKDEIINKFLKLVNPKHPEVKDGIYSYAYSILCDVIDNVLVKKDKIHALELLDEYLSDWYKIHKNTLWYNSHLDLENTYEYSGYWAFEAAALVYLLDLDDRSLHHYLFYPKDIVQWARDNKQNNLLNRDTQQRSVAAGDICPQSGYWFTVAKENSRQYFNQGDIFPNFKNDWGEVYWQFDGEE